MFKGFRVSGLEVEFGLKVVGLEFVACRALGLG